MKILAIDTATEVCSVALGGEGKTLEVFEENAPQASRVILGMIELLFTQAGCRWPDIDMLAFCHGPGSFTGVRVATGLVQGLALGHGLPVMGISTLAVIAHRALEMHGGSPQPVLAVLDARMNEVYWGTYACDRQGFLQALGEDCIGGLESVQLPLMEQGWLVAGNACNSMGEAIAGIRSPGGLQVMESVYPHAGSLLALTRQRLQQGEQGVDAAQVRPVYLRDQVVG